MSGMSKIVKTIANIMSPVVIVYGLYVIAHGHLTPGGGFQGGAVVASGLAMILISHGSKWVSNRLKEKHLSVLESLGAVGFISLAFLGLIYGLVFFKNFIVGKKLLFGSIPAFQSTLSNIDTAGVIPWMNFAVGLKVIAGLFGILLVMALGIKKNETKNRGS